MNHALPSQVFRSRRQAKRTGFTLIELLVVISIIALLVSILLPALQKARDTARNAQCLSQIRQVGIGFSVYADDHKGFAPFHSGHERYDTWVAKLAPYLGYDHRKPYKAILSDPSAAFDLAGPDAEVWHANYGANRHCVQTAASNDGPSQWEQQKNIHKAVSPSKTMLLMDSTNGGTIARPDHFGPLATISAERQAAYFRHNDRVNVAYIDTHASPVAEEDVPGWQFSVMLFEPFWNPEVD